MKVTISRDGNAQMISFEPITDACEREIFEEMMIDLDLSNETLVGSPEGEEHITLYFDPINPTIVFELGFCGASEERHAVISIDIEK